MSRRPLVATVSVIEVRFLRGAGVNPDPVREVIAYHDADGKLLAERDTWLDYLSPDGWRQWFMAHGWSIDCGTGPTRDPFEVLAELREADADGGANR